MADAVRTLFAVVMATSSAAAVSGNVVLLLVLLLNRDVRSAALGVLLSGGLSDLALGLSTIPLGAAAAAASLAPPGDPVAAGDVGATAFCQGSGFVLLLLQTSSLHAVAWTTVHKFTEICFALRHRSVWTPRRGRAALVMVWTVALATAAPPLLGFGRYAYSESRFLCGPSFTPENRSFVLLWMLLGVVLPVATVCSLCGCIVAVARKQARRGTFRCNELHCFYVPANNYLRSSVVVAATSGCLLLCWLPYISVCLYETFSGRESPPLAAALSVWLVLSGATLNPWISCLTHTRYRAALRRGVSWLTRRWACPGTTTSELRPPSADLHLHTANRISTTTTSSTATTTSTLPPLSPETPTPP